MAAAAAECSGEEDFLAQRYEAAWAKLQAEAAVSVPLAGDAWLDESDDVMVRQRVALPDDEHDMAVLHRMRTRPAAADAQGPGQRRGDAAVPAGPGPAYPEAPGTVARAALIMSLMAFEGCGRAMDKAEAKRLCLVAVDDGSYLARALYGCFLLDCKPSYAPKRRKGLPLALFEAGFVALHAGGTRPAQRRDPLKEEECEQADDEVRKLLPLGDPDAVVRGGGGAAKRRPKYHAVLPCDWLARVVWAYWSALCDEAELPGMRLGLEQREEALSALSADGIAFAQLLYGVMLGMVEPAREEESVQQLQLAHAGGCVDATWELACALESGSGVEKDLQAAYVLFKEAAARGSVKSQCSVGWCYLEGLGVEADDRAAFREYLVAAQLGDCKAQNNVGALHTQGRAEDEADHDLAVYWFRKACDQGYSYSQYYLGWMYDKGLGVPHDRLMTTYLYYEAALQDHEEARKWIAAREAVVPRNLCLWKIRTLCESGWLPHMHSRLRVSGITRTLHTLLVLHALAGDDATQLCLLPRELLNTLFTHVTLNYLLGELTERYSYSYNNLSDAMMEND